MTSLPGIGFCRSVYVVECRDARSGPPVDIGDCRLLWTDPPYGTGNQQSQPAGSYHDPADTGYVIDGLAAWLPHLHADAVVAVICDYRLTRDLLNVCHELGFVHRGDVVWTFGLGRPRTSWWPVRHNTIHTFTRPDTGPFDPSAVPRERRLAPKPGYPDDRPAGSVWDYTFSNTHPARVGYPNQKPVEIIAPFIAAHTQPGDLVADPFMGSATTGVAAVLAGRRFVGVDVNDTAITAARRRLAAASTAV